MEKHEVLVIGSGPAGYTAALYAARADLKPLVLAGNQPGGQLMLTTEVENFPGFVDGVMGPEMMDIMKKQAERFGSIVKTEIVEEVDFSERPFKIKSDKGEYLADSVIVSTGATAKWLGIEGEEKYQGHGVSACATCDGFFFRDKHVIVVGGGDSAMEEANFLTKFASKVTIFVRRDVMRASKIMQARAEKNPKIEIMLNTSPLEVLGDDTKMTGVKIVNNKTKEESQIAADGFFVAIGHKPNTDIFKGWLDLDEKGYIIHKPNSTYTSVEGVFVAGDVADSVYRQAITAAGSGCMAALDAERWLSSQE